MKRQEAFIKKLQDAASLQSQNQNNTSSAFSLPSEFKKSWEELVQETILDVFSGFFEQHCYLVWLIRDVTTLVYDYVLRELDRRLTTLMEVFVLEGGQKDGLKKTFLKTFQDNCTKMFQVSEDCFSELRLAYEHKTRAYIPEHMVSELTLLLEGSDFREFVGRWLKLCLHMIFSEPRISFSYSETLDYRTLDHSEDVYCIDGFPKGNPKCVTVLPPPVRNGTAYQGIKPAVLILGKEQKELTVQEQAELVKEAEILTTASPIPSEPLVVQVPPLDRLPESEETTPFDDQPETPVSFRKSKEVSYMQKYAQKKNMTRSPNVRKSSPTKQASSKEVLALYKRLQNMKEFESKARTSGKLITEDDEDNPYSTMPLQVRKSPYIRGEKPIKGINICNMSDIGQKSSRKSFEDTPMPSSTQRLRQQKEAACPNCRPKQPCRRCEGLRTVALHHTEDVYPKPSRTHSTSQFDPDRVQETKGNLTTLLQKRMDATAQKVGRQKTRENCKVM